MKTLIFILYAFTYQNIEFVLRTKKKKIKIVIANIDVYTKFKQIFFFYYSGCHEIMKNYVYIQSLKSTFLLK